MSEHEHTSEESTFEIVEKASQIEEVQFTEEEINGLLENAIAIAHARKAVYIHRIAVIETFLGFATSEQDLAVRMARIEKFIGIGG